MIKRRVVAGCLAVVLPTVQTGCSSSRAFWRGWAESQHFFDEEDIERRARFEGYADAVAAYDGAKAVEAHQESPPADQTAAPEP